LLRAIDSIQQQESVQVKVIVVVNGNRFDAQCFEQLRTMPGLDVLYRTEGNAPLAQLAGRLAADTAFFAFLDDDDEYLPGTLRARVQPLLDDPTLDFTVSNGYRRVKEEDQIVVRSPERVRKHPLSALAEKNWMASCAGVFRAETVTAEYFRDPAPYLEWTYLAYRLGVARRMHFVDVLAYRIHDSAESLSKSHAYDDAEIEVLQRILDLPLPPDVARTVQEKLGRIHHACSVRHLERRRMSLAWSHHVKSLGRPGGASYLLYSRKVLMGHVLQALGVARG
jgi:glycosyltransferase involved in cell wall biosynthesis